MGFTARNTFLRLSRFLVNGLTTFYQFMNEVFKVLIIVRVSCDFVLTWHADVCLLQTSVMSQSVDDMRLQAQVVHCLGSWLGAYAIPQAYLISSKLLCIPFSAMVCVCVCVRLNWLFVLFRSTDSDMGLCPSHVRLSIRPSVHKKFFRFRWNLVCS